MKIEDKTKVQFFRAWNPVEFTWDDVWTDYQYNIDNDRPIAVQQHGMVSYFTDFAVPRIGEICDEVGVREAHLYVAFHKDYPSLGKHHDQADVLFLQCIGSTVWSVQNKTYRLKPGDAIFVPRLVDHHVKSMGARVGVSFTFAPPGMPNVRQKESEIPKGTGIKHN
jgi:mannose-6-phosphate isomerase-like protein (cupin superfamily)